MTRRIPDTAGASSTLSYIDMISGGFGGAFFLFLLFVTFPIEIASTPSSGSRFLDVWVEWFEPKVTAYMVVQFTPPGVSGIPTPPTHSYSLNSRSLVRSSSSGLITYTGGSDNPAFWTGIAEAGFARGGGPLKRTTEAGEVAGQWIRFSDPCPGTYSILVGALAPSGRLQDMLLSPGLADDIRGRSRLILSDGSDMRFLPATEDDAIGSVSFRVELGGKLAAIDFGAPVKVEKGRDIQESSLLHCEGFD